MLSPYILLLKEMNETITLPAVSDEFILFFKDPSLKHGWRTGAIIPELEVCNFWTLCNI